MDDLRRTLQQFWGYDDFRPGQRALVEAVRSGRDGLLILPTGGGKSLCFQIPALLEPGLTLVITPLLALMEDQVTDLQGRGIAAERLHSQMARGDRLRILQRLPRYRLLYCAPETLLSPPVWDRLQQPDLQLQRLVIDEAHCLVQWGDAFRPAYGRLGAARRSLERQQQRPLPLVAFTATADPLSRARLCHSLGLRRPELACHSVYRPNLQLSVQRLWTPHQRRQAIREFLGSGAGRQGSGLIYGRSREDCEGLARQLQAAGEACAAYHAGLGTTERRRIEQDWRSGSLRFTVCTNAFGMGVNKPDVRWVLHFQPPLLLNEYLQEIGRAGRDGQRAIAHLLLGHPLWEPSDHQRWQAFEQQSRQSLQEAERLSRRLPTQGDLRQLAGEGVEAALARLQSQGTLDWLDPFHYRLGSAAQPPPPIPTDSRLLRRYLDSPDCRWRSLRLHFGETPVADWHCGHCDGSPCRADVRC